MQVSVYRFNPETDDRPYMKDYTVEIPEGRDLMVLDVMALIKEQDPSVTYRRSCREGVCGSDGVNMNGKNGLACITPVSEVAKGGKLKLRPLPGLPVIRDLMWIWNSSMRTTAESSLIYRTTVCPRLKNDFNRQKIAKN